VNDEVNFTVENAEGLASWTVAGIDLNVKYTESYQAQVKKNDNLIALNVTVSTTPKLTNRIYCSFGISSSNLCKRIQKDGTLWNEELLNSSTEFRAPTRLEPASGYLSWCQSTRKVNT